MFNSWLFQAQGKCIWLLAERTALGNFFPPRTLLWKQKQDVFFPNSWDLCKLTAGRQWADSTSRHFPLCLFSSAQHCRSSYMVQFAQVTPEVSSRDKRWWWCHLVATEWLQVWQQAEGRSHRSMQQLRCEVLPRVTYFLLAAAQWGPHYRLCFTDREMSVQRASVRRDTPNHRGPVALPTRDRNRSLIPNRLSFFPQYHCFLWLCRC